MRIVNRHRDALALSPQLDSKMAAGRKDGCSHLILELQQHEQFCDILVCVDTCMGEKCVLQQPHFIQ